MNRFGILAVLFCFVIILGAGFCNQVYGQCQSSNYISADDDYGGNPLAQSSNYDPCNSNVYWVVEFDRTSETSGHAIIKYRIMDGVTEVLSVLIDSDNYGAYTHQTLSGLESVGSSSSHVASLLIVAGSPGYFEDIEATANYRAGGAN